MQLPSGSVSAQTSESGEVEYIQGDLNFFVIIVMLDFMDIILLTWVLLRINKITILRDKKEVIRLSDP